MGIFIIFSSKLETHRIHTFLQNLRFFVTKKLTFMNMVAFFEMLFFCWLHHFLFAVWNFSFVLMKYVLNFGFQYILFLALKLLTFKFRFSQLFNMIDEAKLHDNYDIIFSSKLETIYRFLMNIFFFKAKSRRFCNKKWMNSNFYYIIK